MRTALLSLLLAAAPAASAQVGLVVKAGGSGGQAGLDLPLGQRVGLRAITSLGIDPDANDVSGTLNVAVPLRFPNGTRTVPYVAPSVSVFGYEDVAYVGALLGVEHAATDRMALFGEVGLDVAVDESYTTLVSGLNTGVGAVYRF